jgi:hypothetical protein
MHAHTRASSASACAHLHDPEQRAHGLQVVVGRVAREQLNDEAAHRPDVRRGRHLRHLDDLRRERSSIGGSGRAGCTACWSQLQGRHVPRREGARHDRCPLVDTPAARPHLWCHPVRRADHVLVQLVAVLLLQLAQLGRHTKVGQLHQALRACGCAGEGVVVVRRQHV